MAIQTLGARVVLSTPDVLGVAVLRAGAQGMGVERAWRIYGMDINLDDEYGMAPASGFAVYHELRVGDLPTGLSHLGRSDTLIADTRTYVQAGAGTAFLLGGVTQWRAPRPITVLADELYYVFTTVGAGTSLASAIKLYYSAVRFRR